MCQAPDQQTSQTPAGKRHVRSQPGVKLRKTEGIRQLKVASSTKSAVVDRNELVRLQREDKSLEKYWDRRNVKVKGQQEVSFEEKDSVLYRKLQASPCKRR